MIKNIFGSCKDIIIKTVEKLKGSDKRIALASLVVPSSQRGQALGMFMEIQKGGDAVAGIQLKSVNG